METLFRNYEDAKPHLICGLETAPYARFGEDVPRIGCAADLEAAACLMQREKEGLRCRPVTPEEQKGWGIGTKQLIEAALDNMCSLFPPLLQPLDILMESRAKGSVRDMFHSLLQKQFPHAAESRLDQAAHYMSGRLARQIRETSEFAPMWVLSNEVWFNGAASIFYPDVLRSFAEKMGRNCYILPSSVNAVILLPEGWRETREKLYRMVESANRQMGDREKPLSDNVYYYDRKSGRISVF